MNLENGKLKHLTQLYIAGYKLNDGNIGNLTNLQQIAIICMKEISRKHSLNNKAFFVVD